MNNDILFIAQKQEWFMDPDMDQDPGQGPRDTIIMASQYTPAVNECASHSLNGQKMKQQ